MRVCVLTTSYPRHPGEIAGLFVEDAVNHLRDAGIDVRVVSPQSFQHFGIDDQSVADNMIRLDRELV